MARDAVLVVVDVQKDFYSRNPAVSAAFPDMMARVGQLVSKCRQAGVEVVHLREGSNPEKSPWYPFWLRMNPGKDSRADASMPEEAAESMDGEKVFVKYGYDGVGAEDSGLASYLASRGKKVVFVCGLVTSCCVHLNACGLFLKGFEVHVVAEACGDRTEDMHRSTLQRESRRSYAVNALESVERYLRDPGVDLVAESWPNFTQQEK